MVYCIPAGLGPRSLRLQAKVQGTGTTTDRLHELQKGPRCRGSRPAVLSKLAALRRSSAAALLRELGSWPACVRDDRTFLTINT